VQTDSRVSERQQYKKTPLTFKHPGHYYCDKVLITTDQDERQMIKVCVPRAGHSSSNVRIGAATAHTPP